MDGLLRGETRDEWAGGEVKEKTAGKTSRRIAIKVTTNQAE